MKKLFFILFAAILPLIAVMQSCREEVPAVIFTGADSDETSDLAAREIRKYFYQRTGVTLPVEVWNKEIKIKGDAIFVGQASSELMQSAGIILPEPGKEDFILKTVSEAESRRLIVCGGTGISTLYAAYHLAEQLGIGFYLEGDVIPDTQTEFSFPELDIRQSPLFTRRGIQPFHDFPEGPDWWNREEYKSVFGQLPKLKMNFFGLHTYPEGGVGPEPLVWIGLSEDVNDDGTVRSAYKARHFTTVNGTWGYSALKTSDYLYGAGQLFSRDDFGADYMVGRAPWPDENNETGLFNDMGSFLKDVFTFAEHLGITTCLGTEIPLVLPKKFIERLKEKGMDPESPETRQKIYEGIFTRISRTHPAGYYWFWTPENWTWAGNKKDDIDKTVKDFDAAVRALKTVNPGFSLATCGWVLGPASDRAMFDRYLPADIAFSCINRYLGWEPVDRAFAGINGREKWAIPWMEDDPGMTIPQLWAGRMRRDAADAFAYGCNGYFGIHWRTKSLSMNVSSLAKAAWEQPWNPEKMKRVESEKVNDYLAAMEQGEKGLRDMPCRDFYDEWCRIQFGPDASDRLAEIFTGLDGVTMKSTKLEAGYSRLPRPATWINGPGNLLENKLPWDSVRTMYAFVDEMEKVRPQVSGAGNLERFDYWLNQFRYLRAFGKLACTVGEFNREVKMMEKLSEARKKEIAESKLSGLLKKEAEELREVHQFLLSSVSTWGDLGNVTNWQQHIIPLQIMPHARLVTRLISDTTWIGSLFSEPVHGISRIIVPQPRHTLEAGSDYTVKMICFNLTPEDPKIYWRMIGERKFSSAPLETISGSYWRAVIPSAGIRGDFEYYISAGGSGAHVFPVTAPSLNQAVVLTRK